MKTLEVCVGSACYLKGSYDVISKLQELVSDSGLDDQVEIKAAFCFGHCSKPVSAKFEDEDEVMSIDPKNVKAFFEEHLRTRLEV